MGMRSYRPMRIGAITDPQMRRELQGTDDWLRQLSTNQSRLVQMPIGTPTAVTNPPSNGIDTSVYLYLPGRPHEQVSVGPVSFDAFGLAYSDSAPTTDRTVSLRAVTSDGSAQPARVFLGIQGSRAGTTAAGQKRYWAFPSFTEINTGPSVGLHYFVDQDEYQTLSKKTLSNDCYLKLEDTVAGSGIINAARTSVLQLAWGSGYPAGGGSAVTPTTITGVVPSLMIPGLDYKDSGVGVRDRTHVWCVLKSAHTDATPFEPGTPVFGSSSGKELYSMFGGAQGTLAAPATGSFPIWRAVVSQSCTFTLSSAVVTMASTTGIVKGMRMRETLNAYSLSENSHVLSVDSPTQITMSQIWPASGLTRTIEFFGMTWSDTATSIVIGAGSLTDYLYLPGRAAGQAVGAISPTGGALTDVAINGRLYIGSTVSEADAYVTGRLMDFKQDVDITVTQPPFLSRHVVNLTGSGAAFGNVISMIRYDLVGGSGINSGAATTMRGIDVMISPNIPVGSGASFQGLLFASTPSISGTLGTATGGLLQVALGAGAGTGTSMIGVQAQITNQGVAVTNALGFQASFIGGLTITSAVTQATAFDVGATFMNDTDVVTWSGFRCSTGITAAIANKWSLDLTNTSTNMGSRIAHPVALGWNPSTVSAITARAMLAAGVAAAGGAPLRFQSGTSLTTAVAGAMEFTTDDFFLTITTGAARKGIVLDDGSRLTSGRVPFATTNGRLIDDSDFTFNTDTLTITKIAATTFTGAVAHDAQNITTDTTTGTKIGTATAQKLSLWNAAPIVQPTTAGAAATFVTNTSLIANDSATFDGYTLGQVVKALRNFGLLA